MDLSVNQILETPVDEIISRWPVTAKVFTRHRMLCVGCPLALFDTVRDAARIYGLPEEGFARALLETIVGNQGGISDTP